MSLTGVNLLLLMGSMVPLPAPKVVSSLESLEVSNSDEGRSGFQIILKTNRKGLLARLDYPLLKSSQVKLSNRVVIVVTFKLPIPRVLMDGIITNIQLSPGGKEDGDRIVITGEDVSVMMDMEEKIKEHPGQPELVIANKIIASYAKYGLIPTVIPPPVADIPLPIERIPVQHGTDLEYLNEMAQRYGYVFYIKSGPMPGMNTAYWGPPKRIGMPQSALSVNMGINSNVESINFQNDALAPALVKGSVQDRRLNKKLPLKTFASKRLPPLAREPLLFKSFSKIRKEIPKDIDGLSYAEAFARAQGQTDKSVDDVVVATGEINSLKYGKVLEARGIVGVRGVGDNHDGMYYVKEVRHVISKGNYNQHFRLTREGSGTITPVVRT